MPGADRFIRKVKVLQGSARDAAVRQGLGENDLVIVERSIHSLPEYKLTKIEGDPIKFLLGITQ